MVLRRSRLVRSKQLTKCHCLEWDNCRSEIEESLTWFVRWGVFKPTMTAIRDNDKDRSDKRFTKEYQSEIMFLWWDVAPHWSSDACWFGNEKPSFIGQISRNIADWQHFEGNQWTDLIQKWRGPPTPQIASPDSLNVSNIPINVVIWVLLSFPTNLPQSLDRGSEMRNSPNQDSEAITEIESAFKFKPKYPRTHSASVCRTRSVPETKNNVYVTILDTIWDIPNDERDLT